MGFAVSVCADVRLRKWILNKRVNRNIVAEQIGTGAVGDLSRKARANQITECVDQNTTVLSMEMQYKDNIANFVLSFGGFCEVIAPQWLNEEVLSRCEQIKRVCENASHKIPNDFTDNTDNV